MFSSRAAALATVVAAGERARRGDAQVVIVVGGPGSGKTRLLAEHVAGCGVSSLWVAGLARCGGPACGGVEQLLDQFDALFAPRGSIGIGTGTAESRAWQLLGRLRALASPLVLVVDDLQWLDPASRAALVIAVHSLRREPVLAVISVRPGRRERHLVADLPTVRLDDPMHELPTCSPFVDRIGHLSAGGRWALLLASLEPTADRRVLETALAGEWHQIGGAWDELGRSGLVTAREGFVQAVHPLVARTMIDAASRAELAFAHAALASAWSALAEASARRGDLVDDATVGDLSGLTPRERQVADLAATGMPVREIAGAVFLSPKTVEHHLSVVYRKVGVRSKTELAHRLGRAAPPVEAAWTPRPS